MCKGYEGLKKCLLFNAFIYSFIKSSHRKVFLQIDETNQIYQISNQITRNLSKNLEKLSCKRVNILQICCPTNFY